jgi:hypothetical protein
MTISTGGGSGGGSCTQSNAITINADSVSLVPDTVSSPTITNTTLNMANEEYAIPLPTGSRRFTIRLRSAGTLKLSYTTGASGTTYFTLFPGTTMTEESLAPSANYVLYVQSPQSGAVVELVSWA